MANICNNSVSIKSWKDDNIEKIKSFLNFNNEDFLGTLKEGHSEFRIYVDDCEITFSEDEIKIYFESAWGTNTPGIQKLSSLSLFADAVIHFYATIEGESSALRVRYKNGEECDADGNEIVKQERDVDEIKTIESIQKRYETAVEKIDQIIESFEETNEEFENIEFDGLNLDTLHDEYLGRLDYADDWKGVAEDWIEGVDTTYEDLPEYACECIDFDEVEEDDFISGEEIIENFSDQLDLLESDALEGLEKLYKHQKEILSALAAENEKAVKKIKNKAKKENDFYELLDLAESMFSETGNKKEALNIFIKAEEKTENFSDFIRLMKSIEGSINDQEYLINLCAKARLEVGTFSDIYSLIDFMIIKLNDKNMTIQYANEAEQLATNSKNLSTLGWLLGVRLKDIGKGRLILYRAYEIADNEIDLLDLAIVSERLDYSELTSQCFEKAETMASSAIGYARLGGYYSENDKEDKADEYFKKALNLSETFNDFLALACCIKKSGNLDWASEIFDLADEKASSDNELRLLKLNRL